jgi:hypothetical protein
VFVLDFLARVAPVSILDIGAGFGRWGFLCRCHFAMGHSLETVRPQSLAIEAVEAFPGNVSSIYKAVYDKTHVGDVRDILPRLGNYDVLICGDMIEHLEKHAALEVISEMKRHASKAVVLVVPLGNCPQDALYGNEYEIHRSTWTADDFRGTDVFLKVSPFLPRVDTGVVIYPRNVDTKWAAKTLCSPFRSFALRCFPRLLRALRSLLSKSNAALGKDN